MLSQDDYVKKQEQLYEQFLKATEENKERIAQEIFLAYIRKELESQQHDVDDKTSPGTGPLTIRRTPLQEKFSGDSRPIKGPAILSTEKITLENMDRTLSCKDASGKGVDLKSLFADHPEVLQKICDVMNLMQERTMQQEAKKSGYDVKKIDNGDMIDYELTPNKSHALSSDQGAVNERVRFIQADAQSMKKAGSQLSTVSHMSPMQDAASIPAMGALPSSQRDGAHEAKQEDDLADDERLKHTL